MTVCLDEMGPDAAKSYRGQQLVHQPEGQQPAERAKQEAAVTWCQRATTHSLDYGGKPWRYVLIPHDAIAENMSLEGLVMHYGRA